MGGQSDTQGLSAGSKGGANLGLPLTWKGDGFLGELFWNWLYVIIESPAATFEHI